MSKGEGEISVQFEYMGMDNGVQRIPKDVVGVRCHPSVKRISQGAFMQSEQLKKVVFNEGLQVIMLNAFSGCTSLQSIAMPSTLTKVDAYAFQDCSKLEKVVLNVGLREIGEFAFDKCTSLQSIVIPSTILEIGYCSFADCSDLRKVEIQEGLKLICTGAFTCCRTLQSITIPSTVEDIGVQAFDRCSDLRDVMLNEGLVKIRYKAFANCRSMQSIVLPSTVKDIDYHAFGDCTSLREVVIHNEDVRIGSKVFGGCSSLERFKFPSLSTRLNNIIQAGQRDIEAKMDDIPAVEWRGGELVIPSVSRQIETEWAVFDDVIDLDREKLSKVEGLIAYYERKEATAIFELALWKANIKQDTTDREARRVEVPGPVKDVIMQYL